MIKLRIDGTAQEICKFCDKMKETGQFTFIEDDETAIKVSKSIAEVLEREKLNDLSYEFRAATNQDESKIFIDFRRNIYYSYPMKEIILQAIQNTYQTENKFAQEKIDAANKRMEQVRKGLNLFESRAEKLSEALDKVNLIFKNTNSNPFRFYDDGTGAAFCLSAESNGKFKFIKFNGYTSGGRGRNQDRLDDKAEKLSNRIEEITGFDVQVNPFSLEYRDENENKSVLIEIFVKF